MTEKEQEESEVVKEKPKERYSLQELPTQTDVFVKDNKGDTVFTDKGLLAEILNKLDKIEKAVV